ncbi:MAG: 23S rRNA (pseudouridine(1915)-N(3))-methyltransferase RlmH [Candidatus Fimenecus sp.]
MRNITLIALDKIKKIEIRELCNEYIKRLSAFCNFKELEIKPERLSKNPSRIEIEKALLKEGAEIKKAIPKGAYVVAFCVEGKEFSSEKFSKMLADTALLGKSSVCFIIGSSFGLSSEIKQYVDVKISFSKMTFPHELFRAMFFEQLYRAYEIQNGGKYHK